MRPAVARLIAAGRQECFGRLTDILINMPARGGKTAIAQMTLARLGTPLLAANLGRGLSDP